MLLSCANPNCPAEFVHLYEGEWIVIEVPGQVLQRRWLCGACSRSMTMIYETGEGVKVVPKDTLKSPGPKPVRSVDPSSEAA